MNFNEYTSPSELFDAIEEDQDIDKVRTLIKRGCNVNARAEEGWTPLMAAASTGSLDIVRLLVESGADVNAVDEEYDSALGCAKYRNFQSIVEYLEPLTSEKNRASAEKFYGRQHRRR